MKAASVRVVLLLGVFYSVAGIVFEQVRLRGSSRITALHVSSAAGLGAFGLAVAANVHAQSVSPHRHSLLLALSLAIWPVMTTVPAFLAALVAAILFARIAHKLWNFWRFWSLMDFASDVAGRLAAPSL